MRASGYDRAKLDFYVESRACVEALFRVEKFKGEILDPACGTGTIPKVAHALGFKTCGSDIVDRGFGEVQDFFERYKPTDNIVSNPPYRVIRRFIEHALTLAPKVAVITRVAFLEGQTRYHEFWPKMPFARMWVSAGRVSMPPGGTDVPATNGAIAYAWFVFERGHVGKPEIEWFLAEEASPA